MELGTKSGTQSLVSSSFCVQDDSWANGLQKSGGSFDNVPLRAGRVSGGMMWIYKYSYTVVTEPCWAFMGGSRVTSS